MGRSAAWLSASAGPRILAACVLILPPHLGISAIAQTPRDPIAEPMAHVESLADLKAVTPAERALVARFAGLDFGPMKPGHIVELAPPLALMTQSRPRPPANAAEAFRATVCSDSTFPTLLLLGTTLSSRVIMSDGAGLLITVYAVRVDRWIKPATGRP